MNVAPFQIYIQNILQFLWIWNKSHFFIQFVSTNKLNLQKMVLVSLKAVLFKHYYYILIKLAFFFFFKFQFSINFHFNL